MSNKKTDKNFRAEVIRGILTEGAFDISCFGDLKKLQRLTKNPPSCKTSCCMAGHMVAAAARLGLKPATPEEFTKLTHYHVRAEEFYYDTELSAFVLWARHFGKEAAMKVDFYLAPCCTTEDPAASYHMCDTTPEQAVRHLLENS